MPASSANPDETGRPAASKRVAAYLRDAILGGYIKPGERLRQEDIAERLGASRLPVREALRMLEAEGLTELETNKGARVPLLGSRDVDLLYQMRERLEPLALIESIPNLHEADLHRLGQLQSRIEDWPGVAEFLVLDREFHLLSYSRCDMEPLFTAVTRLWNSTQYYRRLYMMLSGTGSLWIINAEHKLLLDALRRADRTNAELYLRVHIRRTRVELLRHPEIFQSDSPKAMASGLTDFTAEKPGMADRGLTCAERDLNRRARYLHHDR
jgi:DNA-binding GntR family transcriptional regulator